MSSDFKFNSKDHILARKILEVRERDICASQKMHTKEDAMRFLLLNGFIDAPFDVVNILSYLIAKAANGVKLNLSKEYCELSKGSNHYADSTREKLSYYIEKNILSMRKSLISKYNSDIGKYFCGNKNFIQKIATILSVFDK